MKMFMRRLLIGVYCLFALSMVAFLGALGLVGVKHLTSTATPLASVSSLMVLGIAIAFFVWTSVKSYKIGWR